MAIQYSGCTWETRAGTRVSQGEEAQCPATGHIPAMPRLMLGAASPQKQLPKQQLTSSSATHRHCSLPQSPQMPKSLQPRPGKSQSGLFYI